MSDTHLAEQTATNDKGEEVAQYPSTKAVVDNPSLTAVFDDMKHGDFVDALDGIRIEAAAAFTSGDAALQKWGRSVGVLATVLRSGLLGNTPTPEEKAPAGVIEPPTELQPSIDPTTGLPFAKPAGAEPLFDPMTGAPLKPPIT
jgi:hypothetical protein